MKRVGRISDSVIRLFCFRVTVFGLTPWLGTGVFRLADYGWPNPPYELRSDVDEEVFASPSIRRKKGVRAQRNLLRRIKLIWAVQSYLKKHSVFSLTQIKTISLAIPSHMRGVSRSSRT
jgi:hypothetical protein